MKRLQPASRVASPGRGSEPRRASRRPTSGSRLRGRQGRRPTGRTLLAWGLGGLIVLGLAGLLALRCLGLGNGLAGEQGGAPGSVQGQTGHPAPAFSLPLLNGTTFSLSQARGHPVVLYFLAPTCASCAQGSQQLARVIQETRTTGAIALAIDVNSGDRPADLEAFVRTVGQPAASTLQWGIDTSGEIVSAYGIQTLESMVVISARGQVLMVSATPLSPAQLTALLQQASSGASA
jgi:peroxiredoxin